MPVKVSMNFDFGEIGGRTGRTADEVRSVVERARRSMLPLPKTVMVTEFGEARSRLIERRGVGPIQTAYGRLWEYEFLIGDGWQKYDAVVAARGFDEDLMPVFSQTGPFTMRVDSGCESGQLFGCKTCECREQLELAMKTIAELGEGMIVHIPRQDGRGMGLPFKLATLYLQDTLGVHTVESAGLLAEDGVIDVRTYSGAVAILRFFGVPESRPIRLATNNKDKAKVFGENGYEVADFVPIEIPPNKHNRHHLEAKRMLLGHRLNGGGNERD